MTVLQAGDIFGDDTCRSKNTNTYGAVALSNVQIVFINIKEACELFKGRSYELLMSITCNLHREDAELIAEHEKTSKQHLSLKKMKELALRDVFDHHERLAVKKDKLDRESSVLRSASAIFQRGRLGDLKDENSLTPSILFEHSSSSQIPWDKSIAVPQTSTLSKSSTVDQLPALKRAKGASRLHSRRPAAAAAAAGNLVVSVKKND
jgi:hypothetical protein